MNYMIIGTSGSGKTTLARQLINKLDLQHIQFDELLWNPSWQQVNQDEFLKRLEKKMAITKKSWVACGNYMRVCDLKWFQPDVIIWLDYSIWRCWFRALKRGIKNIITKTPLCGENYDTIGRVFFNRKSALYWILESHYPRRKTYAKMMREHRHIQFVRLRSPKETKVWLGSIS